MHVNVSMMAKEGERVAVSYGAKGAKGEVGFDLAVSGCCRCPGGPPADGAYRQSQENLVRQGLAMYGLLHLALYLALYWFRRAVRV